jgi:hypothetical protein
MNIIKGLLQFKFNTNSRICSVLDADISKNSARTKKSWQGLRHGSLSQRAKSFFWFGYSWKMAAAEKLVKLPVAASRNLNGKILNSKLFNK